MRRIVPASRSACSRSMTRPAGNSQRAAISEIGSSWKPARRSSETASILLLTLSVRSSGILFAVIGYLGLKGLERWRRPEEIGQRGRQLRVGRATQPERWLVENLVHQRARDCVQGAHRQLRM